MVAFRRYKIQGFVLFLLNVLMLTEDVVAKRKKGSGDVWEKNYCPTGRGIKKLEINIKCPKRYVLSDIEILAGRKILKCNKIVYGRTPDLITAINLCYWKQSCTIRFTSMRMVTCVSLETASWQDGVADDVDCNCFWEDVEFLRPIRAKCVKQKEVINICNVKKLPKRQGMIKSHEIIPWNYDKGVQNHTCSISLDVKKKMAISVKFVELYDEDTLTMKTFTTKKDGLNITVDLSNNTSVSELIELQPEKKINKSAKFRFTVSDDTRGSGGFILCYKVSKKKEKIQNVCDSLTKKKKPTLTVKDQDDFCEN